MRPRYLEVDYFQDASRSSREDCLRHVLPLPIVTREWEEFDALSTSDGVAYACLRSLCDNSSPKISPELPRDLPRCEETNVYNKFLSDILPAKLPHEPIIKPGKEVINGSELVPWFCSAMEQIVRNEDDKSICSGSQIVASDENRGVIPESMISDRVTHPPCSGQGTSGQHVKEQKPRSFVSELLSIEPPQLELQDCIPQPDCWRTFLLGLGGEQLSAVDPYEGVALPKVDVPKVWFDVLPLPCSLDRWKNESTALETRFNDIHELLRINEDYSSRLYPHRCNDLAADIKPIETCLFPENHNRTNRGEKEMTYLLQPTCLLQLFESLEGKLEKEANDLPVGGFNIKVTSEESLTSKLEFYEEYTQPVLVSAGLLCGYYGPQPSSMSVMDSATGFHGIKLTFELPTTCDWRLTSLTIPTPGIIAAHESVTLVPDLPRLEPSKSFESTVVIPELSLHDQQFQFLPVPVITCSQERMLDADFGKFFSLNCEPCTLPATDWLYLDWHFLHGLKCTNAACYSLRAKLIKEDQCQPLPSISLTTDIVTSQTESNFPVELRLLESNNFYKNPSAISHVTGTAGKTIETLLCSPLGDGSRTRGKQAYQSPVEIQKLPERENKSLQTTCVDFVTDIDRNAETGSLSACNALNLAQTHHKSGVKGGNVDPELQVTKYNTSPVRMRRPHVENTPNDRIRTATGTLNEGGHSQRKSQEVQPSSDRVRRRDVKSSSVQSGPDVMVNDFDFFVNARKGIPVSGSDLQITEDPQKRSSNIVAKPTLSITPDQDLAEASALCEHEVEISKEIRSCMVSLSSDYFALLGMEEISEWKTPGDLKTLKQFGFDADGNGYLTSLISNMADEPVSSQRQTVLRGFTALHVLRQTALNLCTYGIQVGHLYLENCFEKMQFLEGYIMSSRTELEEAYDQVEKGMVEDHPKLSYLDKLLGPVALEIHRAKYSSTRILLLADRRAFFTLFRKLVSLGLTPYQIDRKENCLHNGVLQEDRLDNLKDEISEALTFSNCLLVSHAYVNPSFPIHGFTMIIQYADFPKSSAIISSWNKERYVDVHFFKILVDPEEFRTKCSSSSQRQTFCQDTQPNIGLPNSGDESLSRSSTLDQSVPPSDHERTADPSSGSATAQIIEENSSSERREMIIVANISHPNDHMLTGRRSSYQKILHLEKDNLQVVERELRLPVDLLLSPASCIVVYTLGKLNLEPHNLNEKKGTLQNELLTHLKAISFSFRDCIMIFEGPTEFTTVALEISTQIYTLAIALDIQFQCFASRHPDVTDTILIHFIQAVRRSKHMPSYPIMTEGPTLAEVFLTGFPSINPLTAHAILSSGCPLPLFISYASEQQYAAVEPCEVPKHCLELFKAQCTFKAIATTGVPNCNRVEMQTPRPEAGVSYQRQVDSPVAFVDVPNQASRPEVWASFPEFPPASAISEHSLTYNVRDMNPVNSFPDFPPVSQISSQCEDSEENEPSSTDLYDVIDNLQHSPAAVATWPIDRSDRDNVTLCEGEDQRNNEQQMYAQDDIQWFSTGSGCADFRSGRLPNGLENNLQPPLNPRTAQYGVQDHPFQLEKRHSPWIALGSLNGSKRLRGLPAGLPENSNEGDEILQNSKEPFCRSHLGVKRGASSFSFTSPTVHGGRQDMGLNNALGSWNDQKRVRGISSDFMTETIDPQDIDGFFNSKLTPGPGDVDEFPSFRPDWIENAPPVRAETNLNSTTRQSRRPQASQKMSSLDRFRYQSRSPGLTATNSYTQTTVEFPTVKLPRGAPRRSRTQSPSVTFVPPIARKPTLEKKAFSEVAANRRPRAILGVARRGSDTQQRLVWKTDQTAPTLKRQKKS